MHQLPMPLVWLLFMVIHQQVIIQVIATPQSFYNIRWRYSEDNEPDHLLIKIRYEYMQLLQR